MNLSPAHATMPHFAEDRSSRSGYAALFFSSFLLAAIWFGIVAGLIEGVGLLVFQRLNYRSWGPMVHVSKEIIWISPVIDVALFIAAGCLIWLSGKAIKRLPAFRVLAFVLIFLTMFDWLRLTERLSRTACILLSLGIATVLSRWLQARQQKAFCFSKTSLPWLVMLWGITCAGMQTSQWLIEKRAIAALPPAHTNSPNILVIVIDTLRADHLSSYGYSQSTTPNIDSLAREGVLFENAFSACSWTLPSHASLVTGRLPFDHGMTNVQAMPWLGWRDKALRGYPTLGEALQQHGYRTGAFSANQVYFTSNVGLGRGFIRFEDYFQSPLDMFLRTFWGQELDRLYLRRTEHSKITRALRRWAPALLEHRKRAGEVNREALAWIDRGQHSSSAQLSPDGKDHPFFAFLNYIDVHDVGTERWRHSARASDFADFARDYDAALTYVDSQIGDLMRQLQKRGLSNNTLIVLTSDHGESLGQHEMEFHGIALYLEQIHVPLLVVYPGHVPPNVRIATPVSNMDIVGTVLSLIGPVQNVFPDSNLSALWSQDERKLTWPSPISELGKNEIAIPPDGQAREDEPTALDGDMKSIITPQWHLVWHQDRGEQLYDWVHDPGELSNLINTPEGRETAEKLTSELSQQSR